MQIFLFLNYFKSLPPQCVSEEQMHFWIYLSHPVKSKKKKHQQFLNDYWIEILFVIILHLYFDKLVLVHVFMLIWYIIQLYSFRKAEWLKKTQHLISALEYLLQLLVQYCNFQFGMPAQKTSLDLKTLKICKEQYQSIRK